MSPAPKFPDPDDPAYHPTAPELHFPWLPRRRWGLIIGVSAAVMLVLLGCLRAFMSSDAIRGRVVRALTSRIDGVKLGDTYSVDWLGRVTLGPVEIDGLPGQQALAVDTVRIRPSYRALLSGRAEAASVRFGQTVLDVGEEGRNLPALVHRLKHHHGEGGGGGSANLPVVFVDRLEVRGSAGRLGLLSLVVTEGRLEVSRGSDGRLVDARARLGDGTVSLHLVSAEQGPLAISAEVRDVGPEAIPAALRARFPFLIDGGRFSGTAETIASGLGRGALRVSAKVQSLTLEGPRLAESPVGPLTVGFDGDWRWNAATRRVTLEHGTLAVGDAGQVKAELSADVQARGDAHFMASASVEQLAYRDAIAALPSALRPPPEAPRLAGTLDASVAVSGPLRDPDDWKVDAKLDLSKLKEEARGRPFFLREPFTFHYADANGHDAELEVGPKNPDFVPLAELPVYVYRAVTTSEDGGFFGHHGFDFDELKNSIVADQEAGRAVRGGSTISQQLAKNLFLSREKTYVRKLREALITIGLEASLTKQRMLEIYLNVIEWGPGIRGIGEASQHYFGKDARKLTPKEAAFLATIIPNPIRFHVYYERGALTDNWDRRVEDVLEKMFSVGIITEDELDTARETPLTFAKPPERQLRPREGRSQLR